MKDILDRAVFKMQWLLWPPERRYAYLWNRTCGR
jgi:hypothetical protein